MSKLQELNEILNKYYKFSLNFEGMQDAMEELLSTEDTDSDRLFELMKDCQEWERFLKYSYATVEYYMSFFETKRDMLQATIDEAKKDIKNYTWNSSAWARKCKITETQPDKIIDAAEWVKKTNDHDIGVFRTVLGELKGYIKLFTSSYFSCYRKLNRIRKMVDLIPVETEENTDTTEEFAI